MHFPKTSSTFTLLATAAQLASVLAAPQGQTPSLTEWAIHQAPKNLARLDAYLTANNGQLSDAQVAYIGAVQTAVRTLDANAVPDLEAGCAELFDRYECAAILIDGEEELEARDDSQPNKRVPNCTCAKTSDYCWKTLKKCVGSFTSCVVKPQACGTLNLHNCTGRCQ